MSYRDDRDADLARIDALEGELAAAKRKIAALESPHALVRTEPAALTTTGRPPGAVARWFGAPLIRDLVRRFEGAYPVDKLEDLLALIRQLSPDRGTAELLRSSLTWLPSRLGSTRAGLAVSVVINDGATTLTVRDNRRQFAGGIYGGIGGGCSSLVAGAGVIAGFVNPLLIPVAVVGALGGLLVGTRAVYNKMVSRQTRTAVAVFDALSAEIAKRLEATP